MVDLFNVQIFFVVLRESLEAVVVISVLLAFLKQGIGGATQDPVSYKRLRRQVWFGAFSGLVLCVCIGVAFIAIFYTLKNDVWSKSEDLWEGIFCLIAAIMITLMGLAMLRVNKMKEKWRIKLAQALVKTPKKSKRWLGFGHYAKKYAMFVLPFITVLREGLEAVVFVGGVGLTSPASSFPIPVICGLLTGGVVGIVMYYTGANFSLQIFLIVSTCVLYLISAGLFSRAVWFFESYIFNQATGGDAAENGSGPGTYDVNKSVWHVNCCNPLKDNGWDIFNALLGWQNSATYGSVLSYNLYWLFIIVTVFLMGYEEKHGHLPFFDHVTLGALNPKTLIKGKKKKLSKKEVQELFDNVRKQNLADEESSETLLMRPVENNSERRK